MKIRFNSLFNASFYIKDKENKKANDCIVGLFLGRNLQPQSCIWINNVLTGMMSETVIIGYY